MRSHSGSPVSFPVALALVMCAGAWPAHAENIDPLNNGSQYAYAENVGWINAEPLGDGAVGVEVTASELTGWMWSENIGWISLSCNNTGLCATTGYGVSNDNCGALTGFAWAENVGWINFSPATVGVLIDPQTGDFAGRAWGENIGWITFASDGPNPYGVETSWRRLSPSGTPTATLSKNGASLVISWDAVADADGYDVFLGALSELLPSGGDFSQLSECLAEDQLQTTHERSLSASMESEYYLVRADNCGGNGTVDAAGSNQVGSRDAETESSSTCQ